MSEPMTPEEFARQMMAISPTGHGDEEGQHLMADDLMCVLLCELGYDEGVALFEKMDKWYA